MGKSYDWVQKVGYAIGNKRNVLKKGSFPPSMAETPAQWISKHASVTLNQYGQEFPNGGINEAGLAIEILWLDSSVYPKPDSRPALNELQWVQYHLDNFSSTSEVLTHANEVRIRNMYANTHYIVCDSSGECAVLEYLNGKLVITNKSKMNPRLITNDTYEDSRKFLSQHEPFGGSLPIPESNSSLDRFVRAAFNMKCSEATVERAIDVLNSVRVPDRTQWQVVYNLRQQEVAFKTLGQTAFRSFSTGINDPSCKASVVGFDLENDTEGEVSQKFAPYSSEQNLALIKKSFSHMGELGQQLAGLVAHYPSTTTCLE